MPPERALKRIRQACQPCRRKKSKCPGEKPACSSCIRLTQKCVYQSDNGNPDADVEGENTFVFDGHMSGIVGTSSSVNSSARLEALEAKLETVLQAVGLQRVNGQQVVGQPASGGSPTVGFSDLEKSSTILPSRESIKASAALYLAYCDCQPLPLFHRENFVTTLHDRDPEIVFSILALTRRFASLSHTISTDTNVYTEEARTLVNRKIFDGSVRLSTLQSLCLLILIDVTVGNTQRASLNICIAMDLAHSAGLTSENEAAIYDEVLVEERRRCFWSIFMCKKIHGATFTSLDFSIDSEFPCYPKSPAQPPCSAVPNLEHESDDTVSNGFQSPNDAGIIAYMIQLCEVWFKITKYARRRGMPSSIPPWSSQSDYSTIASQQMEFETRMPYKHRFKATQFHNRTAEELQSNRDYWGPWLLIQFLYHTNICLLNHPLLLSLRLRNFRSIIPEMFLQQISDLGSSHAMWVVRFIDMLESKSYEVSDPFLGHCAAIVSTFHLQQAFTTTEPSKREEKLKDFGKCLKFISHFGDRWQHMARIAEKLQHLENVLSTVNNNTDARSGAPQVPTRGLLINLGQFWEILEYCSSSARPRPAQSLIAPELYCSQDGHNDELSLASPLPDTYRLNDYENQQRDIRASKQRAEIGTSQEMSNPTFNPPEPAEMRATGTESGVDLMGFSEDELAALAENFFDVGNESGEMGNQYSWWNSGNL